MEIKYTKKFLKKFKKLKSSEKAQVYKTEQLFKENLKHPSLRLHRITNDLYNLWSISVNMKIRILVYEENNFLNVIFLDIGGHEIY